MQYICKLEETKNEKIINYNDNNTMSFSIML